jgi:hypothetical protein
MSLLTELWAKYPDSRLNQLCQYVEAQRAKRLGTVSQADLFYLEDDDFLEQLQIELEKEVSPVDPYYI